MLSKILAVLGLAASLAVPQVLAADPPFPPAALGQLEGLLDSCSQVTPKSAPDFKKVRDQLLKGVAEKDVAKVRASDEYKEAYASITDRLESASKKEAAEACKVFLGEPAERPAQTPTKSGRQ
jgi:hypothetical protein